MAHAHVTWKKELIICVCVDLFVHIFWEEHNGLAIIISAPRSIKVHGDFFFSKSRSDYFLFGLVSIKKITKLKFKKKKTKIGSNRPVSVRFGFLGQKPVQTSLPRFFQFGSVFSVFSGFGSVFRFGSVFSGFGSVFSVLARFFRFGSVFLSVFFCFGSVRFFAYKTETEPNRPVFSKF